MVKSESESSVYTSKCLHLFVQLWYTHTHIYKPYLWSPRVNHPLQPSLNCSPASPTKSFNGVNIVWEAITKKCEQKLLPTGFPWRDSIMRWHVHRETTGYGVCTVDHLMRGKSIKAVMCITCTSLLINLCTGIYLGCLVDCEWWVYCVLY